MLHVSRAKGSGEYVHALWVTEVRVVTWQGGHMDGVRQHAAQRKMESIELFIDGTTEWRAQQLQKGTTHEVSQDQSKLFGATASSASPF